MAEERIVLEDEADVPLPHVEAERILAAEEHAARGRRIEAGEDAEERRLARAGRAEQRQQLAGADIERHAVQRRRVLEPLHRHSRSVTPTGGPRAMADWVTISLTAFI